MLNYAHQKMGNFNATHGMRHHVDNAVSGSCSIYCSV